MEPLEEIAKSDNEQSDEAMRKSISSTSSDVENVPLNKEASVSIHGSDVAISIAPEDDRSSCKLCLEENLPPTDMFRLQSCGCTFCLNCMKSYVEVLVRDGVVLSISCPDSECPTEGTIKCDEVQLLCQPETFEKFRRLKYEQEVATDPHRTFCPGVSCSAVCHVCNNPSGHSWPSDPFPVSCPKCQLTFCYICKSEWKNGHRCSDFSFSLGSELQKFQSRTGLSLTGGVNASIKRCPVCNILIEKDRGCAQMICKNCSHVFCWYCLKLLDNDFMLRHYDKGPCRNMLGHSRAQVYRHRIGVIGLFVSFSLLLVVASPVLLLAAPIILCCKCKECCKQAINRANQHRESIDLQITERAQPAVVEETPAGSLPVTSTQSNDIERGSGDNQKHTEDIV
uniref:RBR-type E3 ubiquitin transferase n=1 Tax=Phallusia mammillata TaxID=59560 RepID=A0A6F9DRG5_9ASCI|nr:probable E3 ubiquitin-protein ligase RNF144A [Phallusia mammillata]